MRIHCVSHDDHFVDIPGDSYAGMVLDHQELHRALLNEVRAPGASFRHANLRGAFMADAVFDDSDFTAANIESTFLHNSSLARCLFQDCWAVGCRFDKSDLRSADLTGAQAAYASFNGAQLQGARLLCTSFEQATFEGAVYDEHTAWPAGFNPQAAGAHLQGNNLSLNGQSTF
jgi:uncharacterized protein YjbI with pentapeptide repeats